MSAIEAEPSKAIDVRRGPLRPDCLTPVRKRLRGETLMRLIQITDLLLLAGLLVAGMFGGGAGAASALVIATTALTAPMLRSLEAYQLKARERLHVHLYRVIGAVGGSGMMMLAFASFPGAPHRAANVLHVVDWCLIATPLLCASHFAWFAYVRRLRRQGALTPNLMIVGATPAAERLITAALTSREANILGVFDDRGDARRPRHLFGVPVLGATKSIKGHRLLPYVDRLILAVPNGATDRIAQLIAELAAVPNAVSLLMDGPDPVSGQAAHERLLDLPLAHLSGSPRRAVQAMVKRAVDLSLSLAASLVLAPTFAAIALAIRLDSPGPILFKQRRHGYMNEVVVVWKFRSMRVEASDATASRQVSAQDDRVTRVGAFLRKTSLDELPQLWNVIRGEMSLVGPRPHAIGMLSGGDEASKLVESYAHRSRMKPGLTGWAAVNGSRGPVDTAEAVRRRVALDLEYVERQSLWLDLTIMARTLPCLLGDTAAVR